MTDEAAHTPPRSGASDDGAAARGSGRAGASGANAIPPWLEKLALPIFLVFLTGAVGWFFTTVGGDDDPTPTPVPPRVQIENPRFRELRFDADDNATLAIAYEVALTNVRAEPFVIEALAHDAASRRALASAPASQEAIANQPDVAGVGTILVPMPAAGGCLFVRVAIREPDGDERDAAETPPFDPHNPGNPDCPGTTPAPPTEPPT